MSTIVDFQIRELCRSQGLVEPFDPSMINPASIDVTLGPEMYAETRECTFEKRKILKEGTWVAPGEFFLAHTAEMVRIPNSMECQFQLKSSRAREGFQHLLAGYIDPGFNGRITLEIKNVNRFTPLRIWPGLKMGQLRFADLAEMPLRGYSQTGRYHGDMGVSLSKG